MTTVHQSYLPEVGMVLSRRYAAVDQVHEILLDAIRTGELSAGDALHDQAWATTLKISRTPIREAFKRLESHGIVSIAAARFTRIVHFTPEQARLEAETWAMIHSALVGMLPVQADRALIADLEALLTRARNADDSQHPTEIFTFFERLRAAAASFTLNLGATAAAYRLRLALPHLPKNPTADHALCADIVAAFKSNTPQALPSAFDRWANAVIEA